MKGRNSKFSFISSLPAIYVNFMRQQSSIWCWNCHFSDYFFQFTFPVAGVYRRWTNELIHWLGNRVYYGWHMRSSLKLSEPVSSPSFLVIFAHSSTPSLELQLLWQEKDTIRRESLRLIKKNTKRRVIVPRVFQMWHFVKKKIAMPVQFPPGHI